MAVGNTKALHNFLAAAVMQVIGVKYRMVATRDEALTTLQKVDPSLRQINV
jgi:hypothetical protein